MSEIFEWFHGRKSDVAKPTKASGSRMKSGANFLETAFEKDRPGTTRSPTHRGASQTSEDNGAEWFLYERKDNTRASRKLSRPSRWGDVKCAQCMASTRAEIDQRHYWGIVAAFNRSKNVDANSGRVFRIGDRGFVNFATCASERSSRADFSEWKISSETRPPTALRRKTNRNYVLPPRKKRES